MKQLMFNISIVQFSSVLSHKHVEVLAGKKFRGGIKGVVLKKGKKD